MNIVMTPVIEDYEELERAVELQFGLAPNTISMLRLYSFNCDNYSYQVLLIEKEEIEQVQKLLENAEKTNDPYTDLIRHDLLVRTYLHDILPDNNKVLWWCAW